MNEEVINKIFKYHSKLPKIGTYFLIAGIVIFPIGWFLKDTFDPAFMFITLGAGGVLFSLVFYFIFFLYYLEFKLRMSKYSKRYNIYEIKNEILESTSLGHNDIYCTRNYLLSHNEGALFICKYDELRWVFKNVRKLNGVPVGAGINGYIKGVKSMQNIVLNANDVTVMDIFTVIKQHNPDVLIGYTDENKERYNAIRNK